MRHPIRARRERREAALQTAASLRAARRLVDEDVTVFGEQLSDLHLQTLTDQLTEPMRVDYQAALTAYDEAKVALPGASTSIDVGQLDELLVEGRFRLACVLAARDGRALPQRRDPCFFNPQHGPAAREVSWTPPAGVPRPVPVCFGCVQRLGSDKEPDHRLVRRGDRWVPWYAAGGTLAAASGIDAHVVHGNAWRSRTNQAEAMIKSSIDPGVFGGGF